MSFDTSDGDVRRHRPEIEKHLSRSENSIIATFKLRFADGVLDGLLDPQTKRIQLNSAFINALSHDNNGRMVLRLHGPTGEFIIGDGEEITDREMAAALIQHLKTLGCIREA